MRARLLTAATLVALALLATAPRAQVALSVPDTVSVEPGGTVTVPVRVSAPPGRYQAVVTLPPGWRLLFPEGPFDASGPASQRLLTVIVPMSAEAGPYALTYSVSGDDGATSTAEIGVRVRTRRSLTVQARRLPSHVPAGDTLDVAFDLQNNSNVRGTVELDASHVRWEVLPRRVSREMVAGAVETVTVRVPVPADLRAQEVIQLVARARLREDTTVTARATARVKAFPILEGGELAYHRYTGRVGMRTAYNQVNGIVGSTAQFTASAQGQVHEDSDIHAGFAVRAATALRTNRTTGQTEDQYSAFVRTSTSRLEVGDVRVRASPLLQLSGTGLGGRAEVQRGLWTGSAYYARDRYTPSRRSAGVRAGADWGAGTSAELGYTWRDDIWRAHVGSASGRVRRGPLRLRGEAATSASADEAGWGASATATADFRPVGAMVEAGIVSPGFASFGRDSERLAASLRLSPLDLLDVTGRANYRRLAGSTSRGWELSTRALRRLRLSYGELLFSNDLLGASADSRQRNLGGSVRIGSAQRRFEGTGRFSDSITPRDTLATLDLKLGGTVRVAPWAELTGQGRYRRTEVPVRFRSTPIGARPTNRTSAGLGATVWLSDATTASGLGTVAVTRTGDDSSTGFTLQGTVRHTLPLGHQVSVSALYRTSAGSVFDAGLSFSGSEFEAFTTSGITLQYDVPLSVPVHRSRRSGMIEGVLLDGETGQGLGGVPILAGRAGTITNDDGSFVLPRLRPGTYTLHIDPIHLGTGRTLADPIREVELRGGDAALVRFTAVRAAAVVGRVVVGEGDAAAGLPEAVLQLTLPSGETTHRFTDGDGAFSFRNLQPGRYRIRLLTRFLPERHRAAVDTFVLDLGPGQDQALTIPVERVARDILFQEDGDRPAERRPSSNPFATPRPARDEPTSPETTPRPSHGAVDQILGRLEEAAPSPPTVVLAGDTVYTLAKRLLDDAARWEELWLANRDTWPTPYRLPPIGTVLRLSPDESPDQDPQTP